MITHHTYSDASPVCKGELWLPEKPVTADTPKIMLIHGGGWWHGTADFMAGVADRFCREGYIVFNIDYRVTTEAPWPACGDDCLAAADFFVRADAEEIRATAGKPIVVCGVSAGGHLALMTGLRMPREQVLGIISIAGIAANYVELLKISREEATKLAKATKGYAYAYQVLGSLLYESREKVPSPKTWGLFDQIVADYVYDKVFSELSQQTKEFLMAMGSAQPVKIEDVAAKMGKTTKQISPYRDRLIKEGIIESPSHGYVSFALPRFDFFLTTK